MLKTITKNKAVSFKQVILVSKHTTKQPSAYKGFTSASINQFKNTHCGGSYNNITVVPCNNVNLKNTPPISFGYNGGKGKHHQQFGGTRALILNSFLFGVTANHTPALNGNGNYNSGLRVDASMFITGIVTRSMGSGQFGISDIDQLTAEAVKVHKKYFG